MLWATEKDTLLCREIVLIEPYKFKEKTTLRGQAWKEISEHLNDIKQPVFSVTARAVRERFKVLENKFRKKQREEGNASGISPEISELDVLMEEILLRAKEHELQIEKQNEEKQQKEENEKEAAEDIRQKALETFSETKKRKGDETTPQKRQRSTGSETVQFLKEKMGSDLEMRKEELEQKKKENEVMALQQTQVRDQQKNMMEMMQIFMQSQQAQTQVLCSLLDKFSKS